MIESIAITCLALNVLFEASGEHAVAQRAVAHVTINRAKARYPDVDLCAVVFEPNQFSWTTTKTVNGVLKPEYRPDVAGAEWLLAKQSAITAWETNDFTNGATFYFRWDSAPNFTRKLTYVGAWGAHVFYREDK